ncbi:MAG TPA: ABC transporter permease [Gemmatimonadaceae bacterium]|nr:ABC transporter permease [Gemmatimonadaceae bacterium]
MGDVPRWRRYLRFWGPDVDADVEDELRFHLEMRAAHLEARGHPPDEARRLARARFGDVGRVRAWLRTHDRRRQRRTERIEAMDALLLDLRYAARKLRQQPAFTLAVVLVLGLGIGAATAMFSAVDALLLRPLPFQHDGRLVVLHGVDNTTREFAGERQGMPYLPDVRAMRDVFSHVAAVAPGALNLTDPDAPARLRVALATPDLFATLGVRPALGRAFTPEEGTPDGPLAAILSDGLWRRYYGGDTAVLGRDLRLNGRPYRIVGVMPRGFGFPEETEVWVPMPVPMTLARWDAFRGWMPSIFVARLAPGVTSAQADAKLTSLIRRFQSPERRAEPRERAAVRPLRDVLVGDRRTALLVLMGATALVLLVACANVTNLLLSRAAARREEMALRAALGSGRLRLVRQLLVESTLLAVAGALLGVVLAHASLGALRALTPEALAGTVAPRVDGRVLLFSLTAALVTGVGFGLWPAIGASRANANQVIKGGNAGGATAREGARARRVFVVAELALALMLAVGAGLMLRSLQTLLASDSGVEAESVATLELTLPRTMYETPAARQQFFEQVMHRLRATPGVQSAAWVNELPLRGKSSISISVQPEGRPPQDPRDMIMAQLLYASADYFETLGISVLRGRGFTIPVDSTRPEVIINETLARQLWPGENPIGQRLSSIYPDGRPGPTVVAIVGDVKAVSLESDAQGQMYYPIDDSPPSNGAILVRGTLEPRVLAARLHDAVRAVNPAQAVYNVRPMTEVIAGAIAPRRANTLLITAFGLVAVALAAVGVYGVIAYGITRRTREIGIRMALGARSGDVLALVLREGVALALLGVAIGLAGAWALRRVIASLLYGIAPSDPVTFVGAALALLVIALAATLLPARQALRVDPARTIRVE